MLKRCGDFNQGRGRRRKSFRHSARHVVRRGERRRARAFYYRHMARGVEGWIGYAGRKPRQPPALRMEPTMRTHWAIMLAVATLAPALSATELPAGFTETTVVEGLQRPTRMVLAPDGRIFVAEQGGTIRVVLGDRLLPQPFATVPAISEIQRGLLGLALDPEFAVNGYLYVLYTTATPQHRNRVARFTAAGNVAAEGSHQVLLDLDQLSGSPHHQGGALEFGPDGRLYIGAGDDDRVAGREAQSLSNLYGKILRIESDGSIPGNNPFARVADGNRRAIWAIGTHNPFTIAFERGGSRMFILEPGVVVVEEINPGSAGANFGSPDGEGPSAAAGVTSPVHTYRTDEPGAGNQAVSAGTFYRPATPSFGSQFVGRFFFADFGGNWIRSIDPDSPGMVFGFATNTPSGIVDLDVDSAGDLLYLARGPGRIARIRSPSSVGGTGSVGGGSSTGGASGGSSGDGVAGSGGGGGCGLGSGAAMVAMGAGLIGLLRRRQRGGG
jgi:glucose/arabinose dehydrogenase